MTRWRPIGTAPGGGTKVDLWVEGRRFADCVRYEIIGIPVWLQQHNGSGSAVNGIPSHWMMPPDPPVIREGNRPPRG